MNLFETYRTHVLAAVEAVLPGHKTDAITLEPPRDASHGDLSTNAAMVLAGQAKAKPREIADKLAETYSTLILRRITSWLCRCTESMGCWLRTSLISSPISGRVSRSLRLKNPARKPSPLLRAV
jgi:hypothetical protein